MAKSTNVSGYAGRIRNTGSQKVEAVFRPSEKHGKVKVTTGSDLRDGKGSKK